MFERERREVRVRFRVPRKRWLVLVAFGLALAIGVPIAWATFSAFSDVGPGNPFYADINAIAGAGITSGCGGGNFCPNDNITREAEAAFQHRGLPRVTQTSNNGVSVPASLTAIASATIHVGGVTGQTQFVKVDATMTTAPGSGTPPYGLVYYIANGSCNGSGSPSEAASMWGGYVPVSLSWTMPVGSGTTQTFVLCGYTNTTGHVTSVIDPVLDAVTAPFGGTGGSTFTHQQQKMSSSDLGAAFPPLSPSPPKG